MILKRIVLKTISCAAMSLAVVNVANAQTLDAGLGAGTDSAAAQVAAKAPGIDESATINANADVTSPAVGVNANVNGANVGANADGSQAAAQLNANGVNVQGRADRNGISTGSDVNSNIRAGAISANGALNNSLRASNQDTFGATFDTNVSDGLVIRQSNPNSVSSRLGLRAGDRIIGFNGRRYSDVNQFQTDLNTFNANTEMPIIYERDGAIFTDRVRLSNTGSGQQTYSDGQMHSANRPIYNVSQSMMSGNTEYSMGNGCGVPVQAAGYSNVVNDFSPVMNNQYAHHHCHRARHRNRHCHCGR